MENEMPYLMVNLEDPTDCRKAIQQLRGVLNLSGCGPGNGGPGNGGLGSGGPGNGGLGNASLPGAMIEPKGRPRVPGHRRHGRSVRSEVEGVEGTTSNVLKGDDKTAAIRALPLRAKLERMSERGVWRHLVSIAKQGETAKSLAELDKLLELQPNKMRSLKAIMAKLENRFDLRFLEVDIDAGNDEAGNPRYSMPPRVRNQIMRIASKADA